MIKNLQKTYLMMLTFHKTIKNNIILILAAFTREKRKKTQFARTTEQGDSIHD